MKQDLILVCNDLVNYLNIQDDGSISKVGLLCFIKRIEEIVKHSIFEERMK